ncbi:hypothetical protein DXG03_002659 [Asterophora parasitica]|uniref:Uncharacterized protein n=1 Tax=Asterophora parasitica TaxID=117018 RepID=A0A9P7GBT1_9AGAR|nr:hypothetical protein DXG03_002659 [Asterophora parasitica]
MQRFEGSESGTQSPRPETPEPSSIQGRRNAGVHLLDDDGGISDQLEISLKHIFAKYCIPRPPNPPVEGDGKRVALLEPPPSAYLSPEGLDAWAQDTNGAPFSQETKDELVEFLDVTDDGGLTFNGFLQIYQLQTENDEEETWRDLSNHGFDRMLKLVATRREEAEVDGDEASIAPSSSS